MALICPRVMISIHAPARGATIVEGVNRSQVFISIHAPARGATAFTLQSSYLGPYFNSRPCTRGDGKRYAFSANLLFNPHKSTHSNSGVMYFAGIVFGNISQNHCMNFSITLRELSS